MSDPLDRDQFPNRPEHPDFWRLVDVINYLDGETSEGGRPLEAITDEYVDTESMVYLAKQRALRAITQLIGLGHFSDEGRVIIEMALTSAEMDGFVAGARFEREHGKGTTAADRKQNDG
jgi:hypothetical protein